MNMRRVWSIPVIMAVLLLLAGCAPVKSGSSAEEAPSLEPASGTGISAEIGGQTDPALPVTIRDRREADLEEGACWQYTADEDGIYLALSPADTVYSFKFVAVHAESAASGLQYVIDEERYWMEKLTPDKPFLVKMQFVGLFPTYGIVFADQNNRNRFYTINMKGTSREESYPYYLDEVAPAPFRE